VAEGAPPPDVPAIVQELRRLVGHTIAEDESGAGYTILDIAGEGRPLVGVVERRGKELWLVPVDVDAGAPAVRLSGPLAHARIAGPGYKVWVIGAKAADGSLRLKRLGVLAGVRRAPGT
jgi:hypothetical protein